MITKFINEKVTVLRRNKAFDEAFNIFDDTDNNRSSLPVCKPLISNKTNKNNELITKINCYRR